MLHFLFRLSLASEFHNTTAVIQIAGPDLFLYAMSVREKIKKKERREKGGG